MKKFQCLDSAVYAGDELTAMTREVLDSIEYSRCFVLTDTNTAKHCLPLFPLHLPDKQTHIITLAAGETSKTISSCEIIWKQMLAKSAGRDSLLINLGGGMICDLGGFAASTFMRGIPFINVPTTLMAMADAATGGKTAVNTAGMKNMAGTFSFAAAVIIHPEFLKTLPVRELLSGYAEIIKMALISSDAFWELIRKREAGEAAFDEELLLRALAEKIKIVNRDPLEKGERKKLNFGHTVAHALEEWYLSTGDEKLHGECVAAGMIYESWISTQLCGMDPEDYRSIRDCIVRLYGPPPVFENYKFLIDLMAADKKNEKQSLRLSLLKKPGECHYNVVCKKEELLHWLNQFREKAMQL